MDHSVALPSALDVGLELSPEWPDWFVRNARIIESGVAVDGGPAAYALVWEWGNTRQYKKGPRTILGENPADQAAWLSTQAPHGWIAINEPEMWGIIDKILGRLDFGGNAEFDITVVLEQASLDISRQFLRLLRATVPVDSGDLDRALEIVEPGDSLLDVIADSFGEMEGFQHDSGILLIDRSFDSPLNG